MSSGTTTCAVPRDQTSVGAVFPDTFKIGKSKARVQGHRCMIHSATVGEIVVFAKFDEGCMDAVFVVVCVDL